MNNITNRKSIPWKKFIFPVLIYLIGVILFTWFNYQRTKSTLIGEIDRNLFIAAQSVKNTLANDFYDRALNVGMISNEEDLQNIKSLTNLANKLKIDFLYTLVVKDGKAYFTSCSTTLNELKKKEEAHYWLDYSEASNELLNISKSNKPIYETTSDRWGTFRTVLIPEVSEKGNRFVLGADYEISYVNEILRKEIIISSILAFLLSLLILPFTYRMYKMERNYRFFLQAKVEERTLQLTREISERKKTQEQLTESLAKSEELAEKAQEASKAKCEFLATMSHEIRTPLNVIVGMSSLLNQPGISQEQAEYLRTIKGASEHLLNVIGNVLDFSHIESRKVEIENVKFDINELVNYSLSSFMNLAKHKEISLKGKINDNVPQYLTGDPSYLRQILFNLIGNAVKYTEQGEVILNVSLNNFNGVENKIELLFKIADSGIGIPTDKGQLIFEKFSQADSSTRRRYGGTGLGLAICKHLVSLLDGQIWYESEEGKGSVFYFTINFGLPGTELTNITELAEKNIDAEKINLRSLNILLAEDNVLNVKVAKSFLEKSGHIVTIANNGKVVLEKVKGNSYDIILMDIEMPEMDGIEAAQIIRAGGIEIMDKNIPIIALTAHALNEIKEKCQIAGMNHFIAKPIDFKNLDIVMAKVISGTN
ncbi:MAG: response regulator [Bacteroidia bacterium]|nr:response regulator [Bacteroidia bacterium]